MGQKELNTYLRQCDGSKFQWGFFDCLTFSNEAFRAYWGQGYADDWLGRYMGPSGPLRRAELVREFKYRSIQDALDDRLERCLPTQFGALVTTDKRHRWITGVAMGISVGARCIFLSKEGMVMLHSADAIAAWKPR